MAGTTSTARAILEKAKAAYPALYLQSSEYMRSLQEISATAKELKRKMFIWTLTKGIMAEGASKVIEETANPGEALDHMWKIPEQSIVVLPLMHHFLDDPGVQAKLIDLVYAFKTSRRILIVVAPVVKLPPEVEKEFALIDMRLPDKKELKEVLKGITHADGFKSENRPSVEVEKALIEAAMGLTTAEAENAFALAYTRPKLEGSDKKWDPEVVLDEKCSTLKKTGLLTYYPPSGQGMKQVGGMHNLKEWIQRRRQAFTEKAKEFGLPPPKGILMVGPPGSGKSLGAKAISEELGLPLMRCDMGRIFAGLVGASEENARRVIQTAEAVAPCVLWLDEIEKGFAGAGGSGNLDSGVGSRVLGTFLTWMQEKQSPVFVYATANNVHALPPELLRKGRFDETFSVLLPTEDEREEIFKIHFIKRGREKILKSLDMKELVKSTNEFSGAEIEAAINDSMYSAFYSNRDVTMVDISTSIDETVPLSKTMRAQIDAMQEWCKGRTRPANIVKKAHHTAAAVGGRSVDA